MGFFEDELNKMFGKGSCIRDARFVGRACVGRLGETTTVKVQFVTMGTSERYEAVKATVFNRDEGAIDASAFRFSDIWGTSAQEISRGQMPAVHTYNGKSEWYFCRPSAADYRAVAAEVNSYLEVFIDLGCIGEQFAKRTTSPPEKTRVVEKTGGERADGHTSVLKAIEEGKRKPRQTRQTGKTTAQRKSKDEQEL